MTAADEITTRITSLLKTFRLPTVSEELVPRFQQGGQDDVFPHLLEVLELEAQDRHERRTNRLRRASRMPPGKTFDTLDEKRFSRTLVRKWRELAKGDFLDRAVNVLAFGLPGVGKSHVACALGHALIEAGHSVLFTPTYALVQHLQAAKRELELPRILRKLDRYELLILDDIGYTRQSPEDAEVLFTLMAERYERRSLMITSNLMFSKWDRIFQNEMTTAAAIDRLVHHSVVLEFDVESFRGAAARKKTKRQATTKTAKA
jgi:DNA replication protein DnaC